MKTMVYSEKGPSSVITAVNAEPDSPAAADVQVKVTVSGVNPTDWKARAGGAALAAPQVPNQDGAGIVTAIGTGVSGLSIGDRVWVWDAAWQRPGGTAQEVLTIPRAQVVPLTSSFDVGASLGIPALTAHRALTANEHWPARLEPGALSGAVVLVTGGAGAVGHAAIQLAVWAGATVITTVSGEAKGALARAAGAHHVVNYRSEDVARVIRGIAPDGVDTIVDVNVVANIATNLEVIATGGTIAAYATDSDEPLSLPVGLAMRKNVRLQSILTYTVDDAAKTAAVEAVSAAEAAGALPVGEEHGLPLLRFPLDSTGAAHDAVERGFVGKVLVDVAE